MSQLLLAEKVKISRTHMSRIENCDCLPSLDVVFRIAEALDIEVWQLFKFNDKKYEEDRKKVNVIKLR